uniref:Membrane-associated tyrosine- and threonine-specific cdc2-inhibitory kinase n=1 Tax=Glossina brevipalpis TaxID=37001 RepID=A0A1A9WLH8_9MUSC
MNRSSTSVMETEILYRLPVPEIKEESFQHSFKQTQRKDDISRLKPPKLKPRYDSNFNRKHRAHAISFRGEEDSRLDADSLLLCTSYDPSVNETYFEQCFTCLAKIGEGSFGEVFKVQSKEDGLLYAVKMSKQLFRSELYRQERLEEVRRYEQFSGHANCVRFYRAWEQEDRLYMQMELCRESLERCLGRKRHISEDKIWSILLDLLLALKSLHDRNLIHLDIKLDNVLIGDDDSCKLADFGLVIDVDRANRHQATEGDSRYVAPEIMMGKFSKAADIFSLGIAILELACFLELPANGPLWQQLRSGLLPEDFIKTISKDLQDIIKQMMTPNPLQRPTVDQLLSHKKFVKMLPGRKNWDLISKMKKTVRVSSRLAWLKLCNLKNIVFRFFFCILTVFGKRDVKYTKPSSANKLKNKRHSARSYLVSSTPTGYISKAKARIDFQFDGDITEINNSASHYSRNKTISNSTPVNRNQCSFRIRKDLSKTKFNDSSSCLDISTFDYLDDWEFDFQNSFRKPFDISALRGKQLFSTYDDDSD